MKKLLALAVAAIITLSCVICFANPGYNGIDGNEIPAATQVKINGEIKTLAAYNIKNNNYFKLRDIANVLKGTEAQFDVKWDEDMMAIQLSSGVPYSTDEEISKTVIANPIAVPSYSTIYKDGAVVIIGAYTVTGNNYFKLRDLGSAFDFSVEWNNDEKIIEIDTTKGYTHPGPNGDAITLNTEYISIIGKTKDLVDSKYENMGSAYWENDYIYNNGAVIVTYNENNIATAVEVMPEKLFHNFRNNMDVNEIAALFYEYSFGAERDNMDLLSANYFGYDFRLLYQGTVQSGIGATINVDNRYPVKLSEMIKIINVAEAEKSSGYYEFALAHDGEFWEINKDYRDDRAYYNLADVDHDGKDELVVNIGFGIAVYKETATGVEQIYYNRNEISGGSEAYTVVTYDGEDYIGFFSAGSVNYKALYTISNGDKAPFKISTYVFEPKINDVIVSESEYNEHVNKIQFPQSITIDGLK